jgi:cytochrome c-type biogenesis protein CcmH
MRSLCLIIALLTFVAVPCAVAVEPDEVLSDATLEARARTLSKELRCMDGARRLRKLRGSRH